MHRFVRSLALILPLAACRGVKEETQVAAHPTPGAATSVDSIVLERTRCYGTCPAYRLRLTGEGKVAFESRNPDELGRTESGSVPPQSVAALVRDAESLGFFTLPDIIARDSALCPNMATDHPSASVAIYRATGAKGVEDYHGCRTDSASPSLAVLDKLRAFESAIDSAAHSSRWVRPASRR